MNATQLDAKGIIEVCPQCGQKNRVAFSSVTNTVRCGRCKSPLPAVTAPLALEGDTQFHSVISSAPAVLVDFYADWCGPCKMMAPELERVAAGSGGSFLVAKVDTEASPSLAQQYGISALPTLALFVGGSEVARIQGARPAAEIRRFVDQSIRQAA